MTDFQVTTATRKLLKLRKRVRLVPGGMSAGKTISILQILIDKAQSDATPTLTSVVSESFPHLRRGAIRDFLNILQSQQYYDDNRWSRGEFTYTFETGSKIEFFSADQPSKVRGPRRDRLYVNEANNVHEEAWEQLLFRTRQEAWADWNPVVHFYMYDLYDLHDEEGEAWSSDDRVDVKILTYKDNEALEEVIRTDIERKASANKNWAKVYAEGRRGELEGKIYKGWKILEEIPHEARLERRGLDFGFSNDPAVLVDIYYYNGGYIARSQFYRKGMHNKDIADYINALPDSNVTVIADSAEPKSIEEIRMYGVNVVPAEKGPGSRNRGIDWVQSQRMSLVKTDPLLIKSYQNYMWAYDRLGNQLKDPDHFWSDGMDAVRYAMETFRPREDEGDNTTSGNLSSFWR